MKSPLRIFRGLKLNKEEAKHQRRPSRKPDEFVQATQVRLPFGFLRNMHSKNRLRAMLRVFFLFYFDSA